MCSFNFLDLMFKKFIKMESIELIRIKIITFREVQRGEKQELRRIKQ